MLKVNGTDINLTRGDSAELAVDVWNDVDGARYELQTGDELVLTVKKRTTSPQPLVSKRADKTGLFQLLPEDTASIPYGTYAYDVQLRTDSGKVYTVIPASKFTLEGEATW